MRTLIRYLSQEAIENCVMCLNYKFDKVIFFGRVNVIYEENKNIEEFLKEKCNVSEVIFKEINKKNVDSLIKYIDTFISNFDENYIDLTGSDGICEVALYKISEKQNIPMYIYDIYDKKCNCVLDNNNLSKLDNYKCHLSLNINEYIKMAGGLVYSSIQKSNKSADSEYIDIILATKRKYNSNWTFLCHLLSEFKKSNDNGKLKSYHLNPIKINNEINEVFKDKNTKMNYLYFINYLKDLQNRQLISELKIDKKISFVYKDDYIMHNLTDGGAVLEIEVYKEISEDNENCAIGTHLDWDGIIPDDFDKLEKEKNVINEVDVLRLDGYILSFISCKDTNKISNFTVYELESITRRFASKYSKMIIVCRNKSLEVIERCKLVGVEIVTINELKERKNEIFKVK